MRFLNFFTAVVLIVTSGCSTFSSSGDSKSLQDDMVKANGEYEGKPVRLKYVNSAVFDKTIAMYALHNAGEIDIVVSKGMSINHIPKRLDDIFIAAVDNGADFYLTDERDEEKSRSISAIVALVGLYSNYRKLRESYREYLDEQAKAHLGNYIIHVYYNVESGEISHIKFTNRAFTGEARSSPSDKS